MTSWMTTGIASQPQVWARAAELTASAATRNPLPQPGERVALVGHGTSPVWVFRHVPADLAEDVAATGVRVIRRVGFDTTAQPVRAQLLAVAARGLRGCDPDRSRRRTRSIGLPDTHSGVGQPVR